MMPTTILDYHTAKKLFAWPAYVDDFFHPLAKRTTATLCQQLVTAGFSLKVWDEEGGEWLSDGRPTQDLHDLGADLWAIEDTSVAIFDKQDLHCGWITLIHGNGGECISDWHITNDDYAEEIDMICSKVQIAAEREWFK